METIAALELIETEFKALLKEPYEEKLLETGGYIAKSIYFDNKTLSIQYDTGMHSLYFYIVHGNYSNSIKLIAPIKKKDSSKNFCL